MAHNYVDDDGCDDHVCDSDDFDSNDDDDDASLRLEGEDVSSPLRRGGKGELSTGEWWGGEEQHPSAAEDG